MLKGKLPESNPSLKVVGNPEDPVEELDALVGLEIPEALRKLLPYGWKIRYCHDHTFEVGGESKKVVNILATLD